jgi:protease-4
LVAVAYAEGDIVDGEGALGLVGGDKLARELRQLRHDDDVKAVVVRVNTPGGSAVASEVIRGELARLREVKPVVISMGSMAASGGYWIATGGDRIFAEPTTITGSIGVVAVLPNVQGLAERLSINIESVKTGQHADIFSIAKPRSAETMDVIQNSVAEIYTAFLDRVSANRNMTREQIEEVAGGRVWSGADALRHGLVDEIGGLDRAIAHAAAMAELEQYAVIDFPPPEDFLKRVIDSLSGRTKPLAARVRGGAIDEADRLFAQLRTLAESFNDPTGVYARLPYILRVN